MVALAVRAAHSQLWRSIVGVEDREEEVLEREDEVDRKLPPSHACAHRFPCVASGDFCSDQSEVYPCISGGPGENMASVGGLTLTFEEILLLLDSLSCVSRSSLATDVHARAFRLQPPRRQLFLYHPISDDSAVRVSRRERWRGDRRKRGDRRWRGGDGSKRGDRRWRADGRWRWGSGPRRRRGRLLRADPFIHYAGGCEEVEEALRCGLGHVTPRELASAGACAARMPPRALRQLLDNHGCKPITRGNPMTRQSRPTAARRALARGVTRTIRGRKCAVGRWHVGESSDCLRGEVSAALEQIGCLCDL